MIFINMKTTKSIQINQKLHAQIKEYCDKNGLKLQKFVEILISHGLSETVQSNNKEGKLAK